MSWVSRVNDKMVITCGDSKVYTPLYSRLTKEREYNLTEFNFPNQQGSFIDRRLPRSMRYNLEIIFQGEDNLDRAKEFDLSANDPRAWTIEHPLYGRLLVQPISLQFDDRNYNVTTITGTVVETIDEAGLVSEISPIDQVDILNDNALEFGAEAFAQKPANSGAMLVNNGVYFNSGIQIVPQAEAEAYSNLFSSANAAVLNVTSQPRQAIAQTQNLILAPARFQTNLQTRLGSFNTQLDTLFGSTDTIDSVEDKILFENSCGTLISAMCVAASNPLPGNYTSTSSVFNVIDQIVLQYNTYIELLDGLQSDNGGDTDSYIPDFEYIFNLTYLVDYTLANLFVIGLDAQQERTLFLPYDTNIIELSYQYYGDIESGIDLVMSANNWGLIHILGINQGTPFTYYVQ